jgi:hypothetical protein
VAVAAPGWEWKRCGARDGPGDRSPGPVWRGVDGPVTITLPMAVHTLGNIVTGQERPTGGGGVEEGGRGKQNERSL